MEKLRGHASAYLTVSSGGHVHVEDDLSLVLGGVWPWGAGKEHRLLYTSAFFF